MKTYKIMFLIGKDRPGIVDEVSTLLLEYGANLEDSRMAALGGCFSIMALFSCTKEQVDAIRADLSRFQKLGFEAWLYDAYDPSARPRYEGLPLTFEVDAIDHPGIVQKIVSVLHRYAINIDSLDTEVTNAPLSGTPLFHLRLEAEVPPGVSIARVKEELNDVAREEDLDLTFIK
jgi:glycine cleavage system transcriptional repressor